MKLSCIRMCVFKVSDFHCCFLEHYHLNYFVAHFHPSIFCKDHNFLEAVESAGKSNFDFVGQGYF